MPGDEPKLNRGWRPRPGTVLGALAVAALTGLVLAPGLCREPYFADEKAALGETYYYTLFKRADWNNPAWLTYNAYDIPPLHKYIVGFSLDLAGRPIPSDLQMLHHWYGRRARRDGRVIQGRGDFSPPGPALLVAGRVPSVVFGVLGCLAVYLIGVRLMGRWLGIVAALLLAANPLYFAHARRAMTETLTETLILVSVLLALGSWSQVFSARFRPARWLAFALGEGVVCGLAVLAKLSGGLALIATSVILVLGLVLAARRPARFGPRPSIGNRVVVLPVLIGVGAIAFGVFVALNPFLWARPPWAGSPEVAQVRRWDLLERTRWLLVHRMALARDSAHQFPAYAVPTLADQLAAVALDGFGLYSILGPRQLNLEPRQWTWVRRQLPMLIVLPLTLGGLAWAVGRGLADYRAGRPPLPWAFGAYVLTALLTVTLFLPLAWDRYFFPLLASQAVLIPYGVFATLGWIGRRMVLEPPPGRNP